MHHYTLPFGPQQPGLKEPLLLKLGMEGNYIKDVDLCFGYIHRGMEKMIEGKDIERALYIVERVCGLCGGAYSECFSTAIERAAHVDVPRRARLLRTIICELERIQSHLLWAGFFGHEIGYETLFMFFMRERERALECAERLTGARIHKVGQKLGGVRFDIERNDEKFFLERIEKIEGAVRTYLSTIDSDKIIRARVEGVGLITREEARKYCLVGPVARGSGIEIDIRKENPYAAYSEIDFDIIVEDGGDALARTKVRLREVLESTKIIKRALNELRTTPMEKAATSFVLNSAETFAQVEAPRGELFHFIIIKGGKISRIRLRPPTLANIFVLKQLLLERELGDVPVIVGSLDPCFACMERVMIVRGRKAKLYNEEEFRKCIKRKEYV